MSIAPNRNQNPVERLKNAIANPNESTACKECGSRYFTLRQAEQVSISNYAVRSVSVSPQPYYECIGCGDIFISGNLANVAKKGGETEVFLASLDLGKEYRAKHHPAKIVKNLASILELEHVKDEVVELKTLLDGVLDILNDMNTQVDEPKTEVAVEDPSIVDFPPAPPVEKITRPRQGQKKV